MNINVLMNHLNEIKLLFVRELQNSYPPPAFFRSGKFCGKRNQRVACPYSIKCFLISLAVAFFVLAGNAHGQTTCANHTPGDPPSDRDVLVTLYCNTGGASWATKSNWLSSQALNNWHNVTATGTTVKRINLNNNNLTGTIPPELGELGSLTSLVLGNSNFAGTTIPSELGELSSLKELWLESSKLTGTIPTELGNLSSLQRLLLHANDLTGTIPTELGNLSSLQRLQLQDNDLTGTIPSELEELGSLISLVLDTNKLTGTIPSELGNLSSLTALKLERNGLTGTIPTELGELSNLQYLSLATNKLKGKIPTKLGELGSLISLDLSYNDLTGTIPSELGELGSLTIMFLSWNELTGTIPPELGGLGSVQRLYLDNNELTGTIPPELGDLSSVQRLYLSGNELTGTIPSELTDLGTLDFLQLQNNDLTGTIPPKLGDLSSLRLLLLHNNDLTGAIPPKLGDLSSLLYLYLSNNDLSGTIPTEIGNLRLLRLYLQDNTMLSGGTALVEKIQESNATVNRLRELGLWGNDDLTGAARQASDNLGKRIDRAALRVIYETNNGGSWKKRNNWLPPRGNLFASSNWHGVKTNSNGRVSELELYDNNLVGGLTNALEAMHNLVRIDFSQNELTGKIPSELGNLTNLKYLLLQENELTGEIPSELGNLSGLLRLSLHDNELTGEIPSELGNLTNLRYLFLQKNGLTGEVPDFSKLSRLLSIELHDNNLSGNLPPGLSRSLFVFIVSDNPLLSGRLPLDPMVHTSMSSLDIENTDICVPDTPEFQQWLMGISFFGDSEMTCGEEPPPPGQVTGVTLVEGVEELSVSWEEFAGASGYRVQWKSGAQDFDESTRQHTVPSGSTTTYTIPNLIAGTLYTIIVIAIVSNAVPSEEVTGIPMEEIILPPGQVTGVTLVEGVEELSVSWEEFAGASGYRVQWKSGAQDFDESTRQHTVPSGSTTTYTIPNLIAGTLYTIIVIAIVSNAVPSEEVTGIPMEEIILPPGQVTGVSVTPGVLQLSVLWNAVSDADGYKVQWKLEGSQEFDQEHTVPSGSTTTYTIPNLTAGRRYTVVVIATKSNANDGQPSLAVPGTPHGISPPSEQPEEIILPPGQVTGVTLVEGVEELSVSWEEFAGASGYRVQWKSGAQDFDESTRQHTVTSGSTTTYTIPNLIAGTLYTIIVIAIVSNAVPSEEATGTPLGEELRPIPDTGQRSGGGCAIGSVVPGEVSQSALFNMLVVMSALLAASRRKNKTKLERREFLDDSH